MTSTDTYTVQPVPAEVGSDDAAISASDRSPLGRELLRWSSRNSSKGALLLESVKCLQFLDAGHSLDELQHAIREKDLLGKRTREARRTYWRLISWRYLMPPASAVVSALAALSCRGADDPVLRGALYFHFCLADRLTFDMAEEEHEAAVSGARIPIPAETSLEELSQKLELHPISVYWLLKELREQEGIVSLPELRRYVGDYFTVMILRLLGHRWPKQIEANEPVPEWADPDGIIPLTDGSGERILLDRVRERIATDYGEGRVDALEQEFRQIMGRSLADWLMRDFFTYRVSQFKRRPIAWFLESGRAVDTRWEAGSSRRGRRSTRTGGPAFACLVYYHKLTADTLTRIKTHYLRPVLQRREFELAEERRRAAEGNVAARAAAERLAEVVDELKTFEAALDTVNAQGFLTRRLEELLDREEPDQWARRTPKSAIPEKNAFVRQEQAYDPDINDGVRVNIAPLQQYRLLAADVLASKDIERAIEDRAVWRADERRWCREGNLPKPGWWLDHD